MPLIYIAGPYSHPQEEVRFVRYQQHTQAAALLLQQGYHPYSPIAHWHNAAVIYNLPTNADFWHQHNRAVLAKCSFCVALQLPGWEDSIGLRYETEFANQCGIPVVYSSLQDLESFNEVLPYYEGQEL
jgi:hypothetical protein